MKKKYGFKGEPAMRYTTQNLCKKLQLGKSC